MKVASSEPIGTRICHKRMVAPRPVSNRSFWPFTTTSVLGPMRPGRGAGLAVPSNVTTKSEAA